MTFLGPAGARRDQRPSSKAARAAFTARSTSSLSPAATWVSTLPSIGEPQSNVVPEAAATNWPPMKAWLRSDRQQAWDFTVSMERAADIAFGPPWIAFKIGLRGGYAGRGTVPQAAHRGGGRGVGHGGMGPHLPT